MKLTENNLVKRTYGGVSLPDRFNRLDNYLERAEDLITEKKQLAIAASKLITSDKMVYLDVSTTVSFIPQCIKSQDNNFFITNSLDIADQLLQHTDSKTRILGGNLDKEKRCVIGTKVLSELSNYNFDISFLSIAGIDADGIYYAYEEDIELKRMIKKQTGLLVLLVDETKINVSHNFKVFNMEDIDIIITNKILPVELSNLLDNHRVMIIYA
ncbi:DeoR/GlpR family DNA-binding transcription regulator [Paenibacillus sp. BIHB 4019]|uniref:DeoR/GlpR family DNA-binding transcription regulator n=1 Tax=Paenibacillus sp. BIHB 4019 TaxID=1870819 RepID=UPI001F40345C|nr:DeoR/GlpR family DNA-binding transcription regulator [Paenibacillus sp. BIHB 4019]